IASTISLLISVASVPRVVGSIACCAGAVHEVAARDLGVRDRHYSRSGGDGHLVVRGADELAGEVAVAVTRLAGAHTRPAAEEAAEVVWLDQRALGTGRGDLEPVVDEQIGQLVGDALAEIERHAVRMIDRQT